MVVQTSLDKCLLPSSDMSCRSRLATLNEKLTALERRIEYIEARVSDCIWWVGCPVPFYLECVKMVEP